MKPPSARVLKNRVDLYRLVPAEDVDGAIVGSGTGPGTAYPAPFATDVPCSVQPQPPDRMTDQERLSAKTIYIVLFAQVHSFKVNDLIVWVDTAAVTHYLFVVRDRDYAGRGAAFGARVEERPL